MSYISSLNLLGDDSPVPISEEALSEELAIWANAQFTFDTKPGSAIVDESYKAVAEQQSLFSTFGSLNDNHNDTNLLNSYLNNTSYIISSPQQPETQQPQPQQQHNILPRIAPAPTINQSQLLVGKKRPMPSITRHEEEETTEFVEEDKRKRNTAASARFRMKKKLREQALEQTAKEMTAKAEALEKRVDELEKEAKWLRALVVEKDPALLSTE